MHATAASNSGDITVAGVVTWQLTGLDPGQSTTVTITAVIDDITLRPYKNIAEISADDADIYSTESITVTDADSHPDDTTTNDNSQTGGGADGYGTYETPTNDVTDTDGDEGPSAGGEDDADVAFVDVPVVYDLALVKTGPAEFNGSSSATFTITVKNQGNVASGVFTVLDEIPLGLEPLSASHDGVIDVDANTVEWTVPSLAPGATTTLMVEVHITDFSTRPWVNVAEITTDGADAYDSDGYEVPSDGDVEDDDSVPDADLSDDVLVDQVVLPDPQYNDPSVDEDDHDIAPIDVLIDYDLALVKSVVDGQSYKKGNDIIFHVTVMNQGNVDSGPVTVIDHIPAGLTFVSADHGGLFAVDTVSWDLENIEPGQIIVLVLVLKMDDPSLPSYVNFAEIASDGADAYDLIVNEVIIEDVEDDDSVPDADLTNDMLVDTDDVTIDQIEGDEDDHDRAVLDPSKVANDNPVPGTIPVTGGDPAPITEWALLALALGLGAVVLTHRRRVRRA